MKRPARAAPRRTALTVLLSAASWTSCYASTARDRPTTEVVKLLQNMLATSKADGDKERELFAKHKCYCDSSQAARTKEVEELTEVIATLESNIESTQASSSLLSEEVGRLKADISANEESQKQADELRDKQAEAFTAQEKDLEKGIDQLNAAITTLAEIGADQTLGSAADHEEFMAGHDASLAALRATVRKAFAAAALYASPAATTKVNAFLQAPFSETYSAQSGEVVGILKSMRATFEANLLEARSKETAEKEAHEALIANMAEELKMMKEAYDEKQGMLANNDEILSSRRGQLHTSKKQKTEAADFLGKLVTMCAAKQKQYDQRVAFRRNEDAAMSEAIAILNNDEASETFGSVDATSGASPASFVQRAAVRRHMATRGSAAVRRPPSAIARGTLRRRGVAPRSAMLQRIEAMVRAHNPLGTVLTEIDKMLEIIDKEEVADADQKTWCEKERAESDATLKDKVSEISGLESDIAALTASINDPVVGLLKETATYEDGLKTTYAAQTSETQSRREEHAEYAKEIATLDKAEDLLTSATHVLQKYYATLSDSPPALVQVRRGREDPAPPSTWGDTYEGQSKAGGTDAITMLQYLIDNTKKETFSVHEAELLSQQSYEDSMLGLKAEEKLLLTSLADAKLALSKAEESLAGKKEDLAATTNEHAAIQAYLVKIKPGCDFIEEHFELRSNSRASERTALRRTATLLKESPSYKAFEAQQHTEDLGRCKEACAAAASEEHVACKACLANVSEPGYCAGHPGTPGC